MKIYILMRKNSATLPINVVGWLGTSLDVGFEAYYRKKDAKRENKVRGNRYRIVTFKTDDKGKDARKRETWEKK